MASESELMCPECKRPAPDGLHYNRCWVCVVLGYPKLLARVVALEAERDEARDIAVCAESLTQARTLSELWGRTLRGCCERAVAAKCRLMDAATQERSTDARD